MSAIVFRIENMPVQAVDELRCTDCGAHIGWSSEHGFTEYWVQFIPQQGRLCEDCVTHLSNA